MDNIEELIKQLKELERKAIALFEEEVNYIIENHITDLDRIEKVLDSILSIDSYETTLMFNRLCDDYKSVNEEYALEYRLIYKQRQDDYE